MGTNKDGLIFYISHYQILKNLSDSDFGKLYKAFFESQLGNEIDLPETLLIPFGLINNQMVLDSKKYQEKCEKNKENGKKGGRPKKTQKANGFFENPNDNENEKDNDNENEKDNDNENDTTKAVNIIQYYEDNIGTLSPIIAEKLISFEKDYGALKIKEAINRSALNNKRSINYIEGILKSWGDKTWDEILEEEQNFKKRKENKNNFKEMKRPSWLDKEIKREEEPELSDEIKREYGLI